MPRKSPYTVVVTADELDYLEGVVRSYTSPYYLVIRAKVILFAARGLDNQTIAQRLDLPRQVVSKWRKRFHEQRLAGIEDLPRSGRPPGFSPSGARRRQSRGV